MLQLKDIRKSYTVGDFTQNALDDVSVAFRDNEFVAVLGPSGSGKTTLLNIVGGLDRYDSGALIIDGIDTSNYTDRDWDAYRNNRIGFVFQSYNLIPHQTVLSNVELALTLSGVSKEERRARAIAALEEVGLGDHINKLPSQLSGGQMQRVAIARALINDPEILLADEPTGALDSATSVQIMDLLSDIAKDRLVVMVTHNPELAEEYATRTVGLRDGRVDSDTNPFDPDSVKQSTKPARKTSMSFFTAIALSFKNLMTKKGRTLMTAFAGSIGIIGIALILALANGVNDYIASIEEDTLSVYPLTIQTQGMDISTLLATSTEIRDEANSPTDDDADGAVSEVQMMSKMLGSVGTNDLASLRRFLDANGGDIDEYANHIQYTYNVDPQIFVELPGGDLRQVNPDRTMAALGFSGNAFTASMPAGSFSELVDDTQLVQGQYEVLSGHWPESSDELLLVLTPEGGISDLLLFTMGIREPAQMDSLLQQLAQGTDSTIQVGDPMTLTYDELMAPTFSAVPASDFYKYDETFGVWADQSNDRAAVDQLVRGGRQLQISGIVKAKPGQNVTALSSGLYYTPQLTSELIEESTDSGVVQAQLATPKVNVLTGRTFAEEEADPGGGFDMEKLISIDEEAITAAFQFDESALSIDTSSLNFAAAGLPPISLDPSQLPQLPLDDLLGDVDLGLDSIDIEQIIGTIDLSGLDLGVTTEQVTDLAQQLAEGYGAFCSLPEDAPEGTPGHTPAECAANPEETFNEFMASEAGQKIQEDFAALSESAAAGLEEAQQEVAEQLMAAIAAAVQTQVEANMGALQAQLQSAMSAYMSEAMTSIGRQIERLLPALQSQIAGQIEQAMSSVAANMSSAMSIDEQAFQDAFQFNLSEEDLAALVTTMMATERTSFDANMAKFGWADFDRPFGIDIYPKDFQSKTEVLSILDQYNEDMRDQGQESKVVTFTDLVGTLMSSVTTIVDVVSYVLVAFVAISLVVSSIMIGIITYISVLERRKEIGILRSIGASKKDIRTVFNAETLIVGFVAGVIGIAVTVLLTIPANIIVYERWGISNVAILPVAAGVALVLISMGLTYLAGLIPASAASKKDPVEALRSD